MTQSWYDYQQAHVPLSFCGLAMVIAVLRNGGVVFGYCSSLASHSTVLAAYGVTIERD